MSPLVLTLGLARAAPCTPVDANAITLEVATAERVFGTLDAVGFESATAAVMAGLPCLTEVAPLELALRIHRLEGLSSYARNEPARVDQAFRAASAAPLPELPGTVIPAEHPLREAWERAHGQSPISVELSRPSGVSAYVDGVATNERPTDRDAILQLANGDEVLLSAYLRPTDAVPSLVPAALPEQPHRHMVDRALWVGAGGAALASGASLAAALVNRHAFFDPSTPDQALSTYQARTDHYAVTSGLLAGGGATLALGALVAGHW